MTVQEVVLDLLAYAGVYGFKLEGSADNTAEDEGELVRAIAAVNQTIQLLYRYGPQSFKYASRSSYINPVATITVTTTSGAKTASLGASNFPEWMRGCSIMIDGDTVLNRINDYSSDDNVHLTNTANLLRAYLGTSGSHTATVYADTYLVDSDVAAILEPVSLAPNTRLWPAQTKGQFLSGSYNWPVRWWKGALDGRHCCYVPWYTTWEKTIGAPQTFRVEEKIDGARTGGSIYLSVNPMPTAAGNITYDVALRPTQITRNDLKEDGSDDPNVAFECISPDLLELYLLPIARWKYVAAHPALKNREGRQPLKAEYDEAYLNLRHGSTLSPSVKTTKAKYI